VPPHPVSLAVHAQHCSVLRPQVWGKKYGPNYLPLLINDIKVGVPYMPMYKVNAAPLVYDRRVFSELGGFNRNFSCVGDSGIDFDFEYSIRCVHAPRPAFLAASVSASGAWISAGLSPE
jgi:hypothetical protein